MFGIHYLADKIGARKQQQTCPRCGLYFPLKLEDCPHCHQLPDAELNRLLKQRIRTRLSLGRLMFIIAAMLLIGMFILKAT